MVWGMSGSWRVSRSLMGRYSWSLVAWPDSLYVGPKQPSSCGEYKLLTSPENALVAEVTSVTSSGNPGWLPPPTQRAANDWSMPRYKDPVKNPSSLEVRWMTLRPARAEMWLQWTYSPLWPASCPILSCFLHDFTGFHSKYSLNKSLAWESTFKEPYLQQRAGNKQGRETVQGSRDVDTWWIQRVSRWIPGSSSGKEPTCQCRSRKRRGLSPWVEKIPWRKKWQPTLVFLPGEPHGQRNLVGYSPESQRALRKVVTKSQTQL